MKTVDPSKYDSDYFTSVMRSVDYTKKTTIQDFKPIHHFIAELVSYDKDDFIVDYGCGNGDLAFLLAMKYGCTVLGIDYSKDAIDIANECRSQLAKTKSLDLKKTDFKCYDITHTPRTLDREVTAVYLADVVEHLYDQELDILFKLVSGWNSKNLKIIIHTDNNAYLTFIRPLIDLLSVLTGSTSYARVQERNEWEKERHVNLTTPLELQKKMKTYGYKTRILKYSPIDRKKIAAQLGRLSSLPLITDTVLLLSTFFTFLLPSFYIVFERNE